MKRILLSTFLLSAALGLYVCSGVWISGVNSAVGRAFDAQPDTTVVRAEDFHLVQTQVQDASDPGVPVESLSVHVLVLPYHRPQVFKTFGSKPMEEAIGNLPRGSVVHYDGNALMASPPEALTAYCTRKEISFIVSPTN